MADVIEEVKNNEDVQWQELMGTDLLLKTFPCHVQNCSNSRSSNCNNSINDNTTTTTIISSVQLHDIVVLDWIGYYCDDSTKQRLGIPLSTSVSSSSLLKHDENDTNYDNTQQQEIQQQILDALPIFHSAQNFYCCIGDQDVIPALEMGLRFMNITTSNDNSNNNDNVTTIPPTVALIYSHSKYAYGISSRTYTYPNHIDDNTTTPVTATTTTTKYTLPSYSNVVYKVTLHQIVASNHQHDPHIVLKLYHCKKELANDIYQNDIQAVSKSTTNHQHHQNNNNINNNNHNSYHMNRAIRIYQRTVDRLENVIMEWQQDVATTNSDTTTSKLQLYIQEAQQLQIDSLNNISAVYMKCHMYHAAKEACVRTLIKDPHHFKALFRAAKAALYDPASSYDEVQATLRAVQQELVIHQSSSSSVDHSVKLQKELDVLQKEYQHHTFKYKQQQKVMALRIQQKMGATITHSNHQETTTTTQLDDATNPSHNQSTTEEHNNKNAISDQNHKNSKDVGRNISSSSSSSLSILSIWSSFSSTSITISSTKRIFYTILQILFLLLLLMYIYMYFYIMNDTITMTKSSIPLPPQEL